MRIIGGKLKGKKLDFVQSETTRPLRDLVKESIFNIINHSNVSKIDIKNSNVLDLYSGIGSFGIECISREAKQASFVENNKDALLILKKNLIKLSIHEEARVFEQSVNQFILNNKEDKFDIIFIDPPYKDDKYLNEILLIKKSNIHNKKHLIIIHRETIKTEDLKGIFKDLAFKEYGRSKLIYGTFD